MAARGKKHLKIMFTVFPSFKLQMENKLGVRQIKIVLRISRHKPTVKDGSQGKVPGTRLEPAWSCPMSNLV